MTMTFNGGDSYFIDTAFLDGTGGLAAAPIGATSTQIVLLNSYDGAITTMTGYGFTFSSAGDMTGAP